MKFLEWIDLTAPHWGPLSTLLGALIGAVITGLIAIIVNKDTENKRLKEKREAESKMNDILKFYLHDIKEDYLYVATLHSITDSKLRHGLKNGRLKKFDIAE